MTTRRAELRTLAEKATLGEWRYIDADVRGHIVRGIVAKRGEDSEWVTGEATLRCDDGRYIAAMSPPTALALLDALDAADKINDLHDESQAAWGADLSRATERAEAAERERDAYKRAKHENDERFMTERDEARHRADAAERKAEAAEYTNEGLRNTIAALASKAQSLATLVTASADSIIGKQAEQVAIFARDLVTGLASEPVLHEMHFEAGTLTANIAHWGASVVAESLAKTLRKQDGSYWNFIEFCATHDDVGPIVVTVQRQSGHTPAQKLKAENARADAAERMCVALADAYWPELGADDNDPPDDWLAQVDAMRARVKP